MGLKQYEKYQLNWSKYQQICVRSNEKETKAFRNISRGESLVKKIIEGRMDGKRGREKIRIMILDEIKADETLQKIGKPWIENVGETGG